MFYETAKRDHGLRRDPFKSLVVPRPIAWVSTIDENGVPNLAPFSFYNAICLDPPMIVFALDLRPGGEGIKDTHRNIEKTGEFVVNLATYEQREALIKTSAHLPPGASEFAYADLGQLPSTMVKPPRVKGAPVHLECRHRHTVTLPDLAKDTGNFAIFGEVVGIHIDDGLIVDGQVDILRARPLARLGYLDYTSVTDAFSVNRPD